MSFTDACAESSERNSVLLSRSDSQARPEGELDVAGELERAPGLLAGDALDLVLVLVGIESQRKDRRARYREPEQAA
jgi:hypothetical protein